MLNRWVLSRDRKTATECEEVTRSGRLFQTRAAATGKARSPTVRSRLRLTINDEDELERSCWRASTSATWQSSSVRNAGADPCRHLYTRTDCLNAICSEAFSQCSWRRSDVLEPRQGKDEPSGRDLRIVFFPSNRISNRIGRPDSFSNRIESAVYHASRNTACYTYSEYLIHQYFVFVTNESDVCTTELRTEYLFISIQS